MVKTRARVKLGVAAAAALPVIGLAAVATAGTHQTEAPATVPVHIHIELHKIPLGKVVVNGVHRTVYMFMKDTRGVSHCTKASGCQTIWPRVMSKKRPVAGTGISQRHLVRTKYGQVTYYGHPLYYYVGDHGAGTAHGENLKEFGARWYAVSAKGTPIKPKSSTGGGGGTPTPTPTGTTTPTPPYIPPSPTTVAEVSSGTVGTNTVITDGAGYTLYELSSESTTTFHCTSTCQQEWIPLLTTADPTTGGSADSTKVGTTTRTDDDNYVQVTYAGHPLYTYIGDSAPGTDTGNKAPGTPGTWYALLTNGSIVTH
jgi:predicted lipoprotein with Yx(FWY)xxD motif